ncbi:MAG: hypothetical protein GEU83_20610 [Pseudonocardiaceae bacterium]|nr:hypothetical protein [Pseudonocardiaceae bacterium]
MGIVAHPAHAAGSDGGGHQVRHRHGRVQRYQRDELPPAGSRLSGREQLLGAAPWAAGSWQPDDDGLTELDTICPPGHG